MNRIIMLFAASLVIFHNADARITYEIARKGALAKVVIQVVDQDGVAVQGAKIWGAFTTGSGFNDYAMIEGLTNNEGKFVAQGRCNELLRVDITKDGYYSSELKVNFWQSKVDPIVVDGKWQPYGETRVVALKRILHPHDMFVAPYRINKAVTLNEWYGYDLICNEWMPPYGKGRHEDLQVRLGLNVKNDISDFRATMDIRFVGEKFCGAYIRPKDEWSSMKSSYKADTNDVYKTEMSFVYEKHPHQPTIDTRLGHDSYLVFRIRTKVDTEGNLVSAHYGKVCGAWLFFGSMATGEVYYNLLPNDTNLEDAETARKARLNN